jgi:ligand-binding sensor protein
MEYRLKDILDISLLQSLQDRLNKIYAFPSAVIENDGEVLTAVAWQEVCTKFHRQHPECRKACIKSDQYILDHLDEADPAVVVQIGVLGGKADRGVVAG